jgi:hypothetical protein
MSLNISLSAPQFVIANQPDRFTLTIENDDTASVYIEGISVIDKLNLLVVGDFSPSLPAKFQIVSGGSPVTSSVPAWGSATQSDITYYVGNVSGSSLQLITTSGSYGGDNTNSLIPVSSSVIIPAGATGSYVGSFVGTIVQDFSEVTPIKGRLQARINVSGNVNQQIVDAGNDTFLVPTDIIGVDLVVNSPAVVYKTQWGRPQQYLNFDAIVSTNLILSNGVIWQVPATEDSLNNYTSSNPAVISVVNTGPFSSTTGSAFSSSSGIEVNTSATQLSGGAGAISFTFPSNFDPTITYTTISNELSPSVTGSITIGLAEFQILNAFISPNPVSIQSGSIVDLDAYVIIDSQPNNPVKAEAGTIGEPTWTSSNSAFVPVGISGSITGAVDTQAQVTITAQIGNLPIVPAATVILNKIS